MLDRTSDGRPIIDTDPIDITPVLALAERFLILHHDYKRLVDGPGRDSPSSVRLLGEIRWTAEQILDALERAGLPGTAFRGTSADKNAGVSGLTSGVRSLVRATPQEIYLEPGEVFTFDPAAVAEIDLAVSCLRRCPKMAAGGETKGAGDGQANRLAGDQAPVPEAVASTDPPASPVNRMRLCGASWEICYGSEQGIYPAKDYGALATLAKLLTRPKDLVPLTDLVDADTQELLGRPEAGDVIMNDATLKDLKQRYEALQQNQVPDDPLAEQEHREELAQLAAQLKKAIGLGGRRRKLGRSIRERVWDTLTKDVRRLYPRLRDNGMPELAAHLQGAIRFDCPHITYDPPTDTALWDIQG